MCAVHVTALPVSDLKLEIFRDRHLLLLVPDLRHPTLVATNLVVSTAWYTAYFA